MRGAACRSGELQPLYDPYTHGLLRSWKDIARYLGTCVKTVQRWEHISNLPVHRVMQRKTGAAVFALKDEVDAWLRTDALTPVKRLKKGRTR